MLHLNVLGETKYVANMQIQTDGNQCKLVNEEGREEGRGEEDEEVPFSPSSVLPPHFYFYSSSYFLYFWLPSD